MLYVYRQKALKALFCLAFAGLTLASVSESNADGGIFLPPAPSESGGEDSISTPSGLNCRQSLNSGGPILDLGVAGTSDFIKKKNKTFLTDEEDDYSAIGYARVVIPLGNRPKRIDCSQIFQLEIERLKREIELLDAAIE